VGIDAPRMNKKLLIANIQTDFADAHETISRDDDVSIEIETKSSFYSQSSH
jgi:hypothetical protein